MTVAEELGAANAATRMVVRRHPVVLAAILSDLVVRALDIAMAIHLGGPRNLNRTLIGTLAGDLSHDLDRVRRYEQARHPEPGITVRRDVIGMLTPGQASDRDITLTLVRNRQAAVRIAGALADAIESRLGYHLDLRLSFSHDHDLDLARELADGLKSLLDRDLALALDSSRHTRGIDHPVRRVLNLASERCRALDRVCAQGVAGRLGISATEGLAEALLDGALDDFTSADLTRVSLAGVDLIGVRWSPSGTSWPPDISVRALRARSKEMQAGGGVLVVTRRAVLSAAR